MSELSDIIPDDWEEHDDYNSLIWEMCDSRLWLLENQEDLIIWENGFQPDRAVITNGDEVLYVGYHSNEEVSLWSDDWEVNGCQIRIGDQWISLEDED